jgi:hypothetical protein
MKAWWLRTTTIAQIVDNAWQSTTEANLEIQIFSKLPHCVSKGEDGACLLMKWRRLTMFDIYPPLV